MTEQQKLTFTALRQRLDSLMLRDRLRFSRRLHGVKKVKNPDAQQAIFQEMAKEIDQAAGKVLLPSDDLQTVSSGLHILPVLHTWNMPQ